MLKRKKTNVAIQAVSSFLLDPREIHVELMSDLVMPMCCDEAAKTSAAHAGGR